MTDDFQNDPYVTTWLSKEKARQLMRYHGTNGIMITADKVYIKRDGRWICVYRDPSVLQEVETRPAVPGGGGHPPASPPRKGGAPRGNLLSPFFFFSRGGMKAGGRGAPWGIAG